MNRKTQYMIIIIIAVVVLTSLVLSLKLFSIMHRVNANTSERYAQSVNVLSRMYNAFSVMHTEPEENIRNDIMASLDEYQNNTSSSGLLSDEDKAIIYQLRDLAEQYLVMIADDSDPTQIYDNIMACLNELSNRNMQYAYEASHYGSSLYNLSSTIAIILSVLITIMLAALSISIYQNNKSLVSEELDVNPMFVRNQNASEREISDIINLSKSHKEILNRLEAVEKKLERL